MATRKPVTDSSVTEAVDALAKQFGIGTFSVLGDAGSYPEVKQVLSTGLPGLDEALGCGGIPMPKLIEVRGHESAGKSTLCKKMMAQAQKVGWPVLYVDAEQSGEPNWDIKLGVLPGKDLVTQPDFLEECFERMEGWLTVQKEAGRPGLIIFDSVAALRSKKELEADYDAPRQPGVVANFLSFAIPKLIQTQKGSDIGIIFVNQLREKFGAMPWAEQTDSPGGRALKHWCHVRLEIKRIAWVNAPKKTEVGHSPHIGLVSEIRVFKNKLAAPHKTTKMRIIWETATVETVE